jgi:hypothetical protein
MQSFELLFASVDSMKKTLKNLLTGIKKECNIPINTSREKQI